VIGAHLGGGEGVVRGPVGHRKPVDVAKAEENKYSKPQNTEKAHTPGLFKLSSNFNQRTPPTFLNFLEKVDTLFTSKSF
jgi:hypothetical protein